MAEAEVSLQAIRADGGPTRDGFLMQFAADILGMELNVSAVPDCSALGAAMAGMLGAGVHPHLEDLASLPRELKTYTPAMDESVVHRNVSGWNNAVQRVF